jgi:hypothetical protein
LVLLLAVGLVSGFITWTRYVLLEDLRVSAERVDVRIDRAVTLISQLGAAQQSYIAPDQREREFARVSLLMQQLASELKALAPLARSAEARARLETLTGSAAVLAEIDARARDNIGQDHNLIAADLILSGGRNTLDGMHAGLGEMRRGQRAADDIERVTLLEQQWLALGIAGALWTIGLMAFATAVPRPEPQPAVVAREAAPENTLAEAPREHPVGPVIDIAAAADVCTAMSCATSVAALPGLLGRAQSVLDASGIMLWLGVGSELRAVSAAGYPPGLTARLPVLGLDSDNATSTAWRTGKLQTVASGTHTSGAIVAPVLGSESCIGALAVEVGTGRETDATASAVVSLFAAQLAALLTMSPPGTDQTAASPASTFQHSGAGPSESLNASA